MARREFLQLADHYDPHKHDVAGWFVSEKLDGTRCFWDGGITRGLPTEQVPWASIIDPKTGEKKAKIKPVGNRPVEPLRQSDHGPGLVAQPASLLSAGRRVVGRAGQVPTLPVDLRRRYPGRTLRQDRLRGLLHAAAGRNLRHRRRSRTPTWSATSITSRLRRGSDSGSIRRGEPLRRAFPSQSAAWATTSSS